MKFIILFFLVLLTACNSGSFKQSPSDTTRTVAIYTVNPNDWDVHTTWAWRLTKDTFIQSSPYKGIWGRDTSYYVPLKVPEVDSLKHQVFDSSNQPKYIIQLYPLPKKYLIKDLNAVYPQPNTQLPQAAKP